MGRGKTMVYTGPGHPRNHWSAPGERIHITNFATAINDIEVLQRIPFYFVMADEASFIKNPAGHQDPRRTSRGTPLGPDRPEKFKMERWCKLTAAQRALYNEIQRLKVRPVHERLLAGEEVDVTTCILPLITELKQICNHPILVTGDTERLYGQSEKFGLCGRSWRRSSSGSHLIGFLAWALRERGVPHIRIHGDTGTNSSPGSTPGEARVALYSLRAAGHGINLPAANRIFGGGTRRWRTKPPTASTASARIRRSSYRIPFLRIIEERILECRKGISERVIGAVAGTGAAKSSSVPWTKTLPPVKGRSFNAPIAPCGSAGKGVHHPDDGGKCHARLIGGKEAEAP